MTKICTKCKEEKLLTAFHTRKDSKCGYVSHCKSCKAIHDKEMGYAKAPSRKKKAYETAKYKYQHDAVFRAYVCQKRKEYCERNRKKVLWSQAKIRAHRAQLEFAITIEDIVIPEKCPLLDVILEHGTKKVKGNSPSLDRIDNAQGYIKSNIAVISYRANTMKNNASLEEIISFCDNLRKYISNDIVQPSGNDKSEELKDKEPLG